MKECNKNKIPENKIKKLNNTINKLKLDNNDILKKYQSDMN